MRFFADFMSVLLLAGNIESYMVLAAKTALPKSGLSSQQEFDKYWAYNYPWGTDHNGSARMSKDQVKLENGTMTITAKRVSGQKPARHGGKDIAIRYMAGAINSKERWTVAKGGGFDFLADLKATVSRGTWPAFWLTAVDGWPPEVDMAEWKGSGKVSFNTFNTSSQVTAKDVAYPSPGEFHTFRCELRDSNGKDVAIKFFMDGKLVTSQVGRGFTGKAMYL
jgi:galactan endo-beta-1,3-galactanase